MDMQQGRTAVNFEESDMFVRTAREEMAGNPELFLDWRAISWNFACTSAIPFGWWSRSTEDFTGTVNSGAW